MASRLSAIDGRRAGRVAGLAGVLLVVGFGGAALADLAPPQICTAPGQPCDKAGPSANQPGTCTASTCERSAPLPDGGRGTMTYACNLCTPSAADGGAGDASVVQDGAVGTGGTGTGGAGTGGAGAATGGTSGTGGAAGQSGTGGATGTGGRAADAGTDQRSNGSGCAIAARPVGDPPFLLVVVAGLMLFVRSRRRAR